MKLLEFQRYYNGHRTHAGLDGRTPEIANTYEVFSSHNSARVGQQIGFAERQYAGGGLSLTLEV